ncbi:MAG: hypothetical protein M1812_000753 [Candelaria pacifica]|nr:MAG: hypothetical protein M1812_000753 [Candelaria pacifica]
MEFPPNLPSIGDEDPFGEDLLIRYSGDSRALKWHFSALEPDSRGVNDTRACACEMVAWRLLTHLSEHDIIDVVLYELPPISSGTGDGAGDAEQGHANDQPHDPSETSPLLEQRVAPEGKDPTSMFRGLNALEIAVVADAKKFLSQKAVQKIVNGIWHGEVVFWDSMSVRSRKKAHVYNPKCVSLEHPFNPSWYLNISDLSLAPGTIVTFL